MNTTKQTLIALITTVLVTAWSSSNAAVTQFGHTDNLTNYIFLFANTGPGTQTPLTFNDVTFSGGFITGGWGLAQPIEPTVAIFTGASQPVGTGTTYDLDFNATKNIVSMQWTEVVYAGGGSWSTAADGTRDYNSTLGIWTDVGTPFSAANTARVTDYFNALPPAPVPLPNSVVLLLSALAYLGCRRKKEQGLDAALVGNA